MPKTMRAYLLIPALAVTGLLAAPAPARSQDDDLKKLLDQLNSGRVIDQKANLESIRAQRERTVTALIQFVRDRAAIRTNSNYVFMTQRAIALLGKLRAVEAVPVLAENLTFTRKPQGNGFAGPPPSVEGDWPAVAALIRIGAQSLDPVVGRVASTDEDLVARCGALVVVGVLEPPLASVYLKDCLDREKDLRRRYRLKRMLEVAEEIGRNPKREIIK